MFYILLFILTLQNLVSVLYLLHLRQLNSYLPHFILFYFTFYFRGEEGEGQRERERIVSRLALSTEPNTGLNPTILGS